jgi:dihydrofolate reductase
MRKLVFAINITLDGCCDHTKGIPDEDLHDYHTNLLREADVLLYGRKTYQLMVPFWPDVAKANSDPSRSMIEFARTFVAVKNIVVFSRTLTSVEGKNTRIVSGPMKDEILKLKQGEGKNILVGGVDVPSQLMQLGLIDEYHVVVQPIIVGEGRRLLEGVSLQEGLQLKLVESRTFRSGTVALRYLKS